MYKWYSLKIHLPIIKDGDSLEFLSQAKNRWHKFFVYLLPYVKDVTYIYISAYINTEVLHDCKYIPITPADCGTRLHYHEVQKHSNSLKHLHSWNSSFKQLHLWDLFSSLHPEVLMSSLAPYSITFFSHPLPKAEFRNYEKLILKYWYI